MVNNNYNPIEVFNRIYHQYYKSIVSYFSKRYNSSEAEDLAQITFTKLWQYIPTCQVVKNEKSLVFKIAKNVLIDKKRQKVIAESLDEIKSIEYHSDFSSVEIQSVINSFEFRDREIIALKQAGFSSREIAKIQGVAPSTIRSRLQEIRKYISNSMNN